MNTSDDGLLVDIQSSTTGGENLEYIVHIGVHPLSVVRQTTEEEKAAGGA